MQCLSASGQLGYGIPEEAFLEGVSRKPDLIGADLGSIDPGPFYLGSGKTAAGQAGLRRDLRLVLTAARDLHVPLVLGSAGTAGAAPHVRQVRQVIEELAAELGAVELAVITSDVDPELVLTRAADGKVQPCGSAPPLHDGDVHAAVGLVAQMGVEPIQAALRAGSQVVLTGRACDTAIFSALPRLVGHDAGLSTHLAKIIECTSLCAEPATRDAAAGTIGRDWFTIEPMASGSRCTPASVSAHAMYEQADPTVIAEPGGVVSLRDAVYEAAGDRAVRVRGSRWLPDDVYRVKLEGARLSGYRAISLGGIRDPYLIAALPEALEKAKKATDHALPTATDAYHLRFRSYGHDGVLANLEPGSMVPAEVLVNIDVVAETQDLAVTACGIAKQALLHASYAGMRSNGANLAIPFAPDVLSLGPVYEFCVHHLMELAAPSEVFPIEFVTVGAAA